MPLIQGIRISELTPKAVPSASDLFVMAKELDTNFKITFSELEEALNKLTTQGDILTHDGTNSVRLGVGTSGQVLKSDGSSVSWEDFGNFIPDIGQSDAELIAHYSTGWEVVTPGSNNQVLQTVNGVISWQSLDLYESPLTTSGDLLTHNGSIDTRLAAGSEGEFLRISSGVPSWETVNIFEDPLTTNGDILARISGQTTRLPIGDDNQVLTVVSGELSWQDAGTYQDPLTTQGDILTHSGSASIRLPIGSNGQVLTVNNGSVSWQTPTDESLTDPTINTGDIIYRSGGSLTRRGIGNEGQILAVTSGVPQWITVPGITDVDNYFRTVSVSGEDDIVASGESDALTFVAGTGITLTTDSVAKTLTINGASTLSVGSDNQIPIVNASGDNFEYNSNFTFNASTSDLQVGTNAILEGDTNPRLILGNGVDGFHSIGFNTSSGALSVQSGGRNLYSTSSDTSAITFQEDVIMGGAFSTSGNATIGNALSVTGLQTFVNGTIVLPTAPTTTTDGSLRRNASTNKLQMYFNSQWNDVDSTSTVDTNDYVDSISFSTSNGVLTLGRSGSLANLTQDLDGRWLEIPSLTGSIYPLWSTGATNFISGNIQEIPAANETRIRGSFAADDNVVYIGDSSRFNETASVSKGFGFRSSMNNQKAGTSIFAINSTSTISSASDSQIYTLINSSSNTISAKSAFQEPSATLIDTRNTTISGNMTAIRLNSAGVRGDSYNGYVYVGKLAIHEIDDTLDSSDNSLLGVLAVKSDRKVAQISINDINTSSQLEAVSRFDSVNLGVANSSNNIKIKKRLIGASWGTSNPKEINLNTGAPDITDLRQILSVEITTFTNTSQLTGELYNNSDEHVWWRAYTSGSTRFLELNREGSSFKNAAHNNAVVRILITYYVSV